MYIQRCSSKKMYLQPQLTPKRTFLSPSSKFGQRSFSASSLVSYPTPQVLPGSLREQIRLDTFKKNLAQSKLNKTALHRATLKVDSQQRSMFRNDVRAEVRQLQREISILRQQNNQLKQQKTSDMCLITQQNDLLSHLEKEINQYKENVVRSSKQCDCYLVEQYADKIRSLEMKISHLEEEKREYKKQIRELVVTQEQIKAELEGERDRKKKKTGEIREFREIREIKEPRQRKKEHSKKNSQDGVMRYMEYLKNFRNREIDQIQNILREE